MENKLEFLEELRSHAQIGLTFANNDYDKKRYARLLEIAAIQYSELSGLTPDFILEKFKKDIGYITPKIGIDGAVFNDNGEILLVKRADDKLWALPCGWAEVNETPQHNIERELREETGLICEAKELIYTFSRMPGTDNQPHTTYHFIYHCILKGGKLKINHENLDAGFYDYTIITEWHYDHRDRAEKCYNFWKELKDKTS